MEKETARRGHVRCDEYTTAFIHWEYYSSFRIVSSQLLHCSKQPLPITDGRLCPLANPVSTVHCSNSRYSSSLKYGRLSHVKTAINTVTPHTMLIIQYLLTPARFFWIYIHWRRPDPHKLGRVTANLLVDGFSSQRKRTPAAQNWSSLINLQADQEILFFFFWQDFPAYWNWTLFLIYSFLHSLPFTTTNYYCINHGVTNQPWSPVTSFPSFIGTQT